MRYKPRRAVPNKCDGVYGCCVLPEGARDVLSRSQEVQANHPATAPKGLTGTYTLSGGDDESAESLLWGLCYHFGDVGCDEFSVCLWSKLFEA